MCGIFGYTKYTSQTPYICSILASEMENRGRDSWGRAAVMPDNSVQIDKDVGTITSNWFRAYPNPDMKAAIFHTRAASTGEVNKENAHPFTFPTQMGGRLIGTHNGVISNHRQLATKYGRKFPVDTMHAFANIAEGKPTKEIDGWGALAWLIEHPKHTFMCWVRFNMQDLHFALLGEEYGVYYASEKDALVKAVGMWLPSAERRIVTIQHETLFYCDLRNEPHNVYSAFDMPFGYRYRATTGYSGVVHHWSSSAGDDDDGGVCLICGDIQAYSSMGRVCYGCLVEYATAFERIMKQGKAATA